MEDTRLQPHSSQCPEENTAHYNGQEATACGHRAEFSQALRQLNENTYELESSRNGHMIWAYSEYRCHEKLPFACCTDFLGVGTFENGSTAEREGRQTGSQSYVSGKQERNVIVKFRSLSFSYLVRRTASKGWISNSRIQRTTELIQVECNDRS